MRSWCTYIRTYTHEHTFYARTTPSTAHHQSETVGASTVEEPRQNGIIKSGEWWLCCCCWCRPTEMCPSSVSFWYMNSGSGGRGKEWGSDENDVGRETRNLTVYFCFLLLLLLVSSVCALFFNLHENAESTKVVAKIVPYYKLNPY